MPTEFVVKNTNSRIAESSGKLTASAIAITNHASNPLPGILFITSYPPRECGIATYSHDLIKVLNTKFRNSFTISICPLESDFEKYNYTEKIKYTLNTDQPNAFIRLAKKINEDESIRMILIQHEFGFFEHKEEKFERFLFTLTKPVILVFHTVLPHPNETLKEKVQQLALASDSILVMTHFSENVLITDYGIAMEKITVIPHGTHLVPHADKAFLKNKYNLSGKKILSTFGLLSSGKNIETTLDALPAVIETNPDVLFLIIGKTHPSVVKQEGEKYRTKLQDKVAALHLEQHVQFIHSFLPLPELLEYLQLTDIYLFTSKDPNQAVSGTFSYAISCGCPVISTPIPHAREVLKNDAGMIIDFESPEQLRNALIILLSDEQLRINMGSNGLHKMASTAWENAAISHAQLFEKITDGQISLHHTIPGINLNHIKKLTTEFGMIQFAKINQPDLESGYTLDDNSRALIAMCQHFELTKDESDLNYISLYFHFIKYCLQPEGSFLNYVDIEGHFTPQNNLTNLADSNGRAIWALGYLISIHSLLPAQLAADAVSTLQKAFVNMHKIHSTRAMAFAIKGLYYSNTTTHSDENISLIKVLADRLVQMYRHETDGQWRWFESYLTYANSIVPEALLCAWIATQEPVYKEIARSSFDFLLSRIYRDNRLKVISNKGWLRKGEESTSAPVGGEQPIDVAYTILALHKFYDVFHDESYLHKMEISFNWFLGVNHLNQIIYNPCTGGCYDGLEENYVNLNQGAESTVSYLMARLTVEKYFNKEYKVKRPKGYYLQYNM